MKLFIFLPLLLVACAGINQLELNPLDNKDKVGIVQSIDTIEVIGVNIYAGDEDFKPRSLNDFLAQEAIGTKSQQRQRARNAKRKAKKKARAVKKALKRKYKLDKKKIPTNSQVRQANKSKRVESRSNKKITKSNNSVIKTENRNNRKKTNKFFGTLKYLLIFASLLTITIIYYAKHNKSKNDNSRSEDARSISKGNK